MKRFWGKVQKTNGCWLWTAAKYSNGYGAARDQNQRQTTAHRVAWMLKNGDIPTGMYICHTCDNRACVKPEHLFLCTQKNNIQDAIGKGRLAYGKQLNHPPQQGELNHNSRVTEDTVRLIRDLYSNGKSQAEIARQTGVNRQNVWAIVHRKSWTHVE